MQDADLIAQQCIHQDATTPIEVARFASAYFLAKSQALSETPFKLYEWATLIDPRNHRYRIVPALINSRLVTPPEQILRAMNNLADALQDNSLTPEEAYREFETIHPFIDGNGRVGHLLWAYLTRRATGVWPMEMPPQLDWSK